MFKKTSAKNRLSYKIIIIETSETSYIGYATVSHALVWPIKTTLKLIVILNERNLCTMPWNVTKQC